MTSYYRGCRIYVYVRRRRGSEPAAYYYVVDAIERPAWGRFACTADFETTKEATDAAMKAIDAYADEPDRRPAEAVLKS
jgi:hypothetical protein